MNKRYSILIIIILASLGIVVSGKVKGIGEKMHSFGLPSVSWQAQRQIAHNRIIQCLCQKLDSGEVQKEVILTYVTDNIAEIMNMPISEAKE